MHAHNRTLIAKLGFADPDRKEPLHDLACRYLTSGDRPLRTMRVMFPGVERAVTKDEYGRLTGSSWASDFGYSHETALSKGDGSYKTTVGFLDVVITGKVEEITVSPKWTDEERAAWYTEQSSSEFSTKPDELERIAEGLGREETTDARHVATLQAVIEVKAGATSASEVLRQINLYREYYFPEANRKALVWALAVCFDVNETYVATLAHENIRVIRLGQAFRDWAAAEQANAVTAKLEEI